MRTIWSNKKYNVKLFHGNCLRVLPRLLENSIDMVLCDPPYGITACKWDSIISLEIMWEQINFVIKNNSAVVMFASQPFTTKLISSNMKMFKYCWVWDKQSGGAFVGVEIEKNYFDISVRRIKQAIINHSNRLI